MEQITVIMKKNDSLWYYQFHACAIISHRNIIKTLNKEPSMNDLQCNEFYDVVIDAVLTSKHHQTNPVIYRKTDIRSIFQQGNIQWSRKLLWSSFTKLRLWSKTKLHTTRTKQWETKIRKRNIIWFNPPFSKNVATDVGNHFNNKHKFKKIFNKNKLKINYSCMPSMKTIRNSHNRKVLSSAETRNEKTCNCRVKENCPLQGNCLTANNL